MAGRQGSQILHRKLNVVDDRERNQNPEQEEESGMIALSQRFEKQVGQQAEPDNRQGRRLSPR